METLESRRLLASDSFEQPELTAIVNESASVTDNTNDASEIRVARASDHDLGSVKGNRLVTGILTKSDSYDILKFKLDGKAPVKVTLSNLQLNADVYLLNDVRGLVAYSTKPGHQNDSVDQTLDAGAYTVVVLAKSPGETSYRLVVSTEPEKPPTTAKPTEPAEPNPIKRLPDVANFGGSRQWGLDAIGAPEAWAQGYTGQGVTVAIVDTGVDLDHPDLVHSIYVNPGELAGNGIDDDRNGYVDDVHGYDFADRDAVANDTHGHGTHVAGTVAAANNGVGATGVAPDATIIPVRVLGSGTGNSTDVAAGIRYAANLGADIINLSLGGGYSTAIGSAIDYARSLGSLVVAAAGNRGASVPDYPSRFSATDANVISVGAYSSNGTKAGFSNRVGGSGAIQIDAPGVGIYSTYRSGRYAMMSGTSMAAPHVSGLAALILSAKQNLAPAELRQLLVRQSEGSAQNSDSLGKANAQTSVAYAASGIAIASSAETVSTSHARSQTSSASAVDTVHTSALPETELIATRRWLDGSAFSLPLASRTPSELVADFANHTESGKSPLDLYFENVGGDSSRHFDAQIPLDTLDFA